MLRCILSTLAYVVFVYGISMVSLLDFTAIFNTLPFWASLLGWVFLSERLSQLEICALFFSFGGVLCVAFGNKDDAKEAEEVKSEGAMKAVEQPGTHLLGCIMIFLSALSYAGTINITRRMQSYNFGVMLFWYAVFAAPVTMVMIFCDCLATRRTIHLLSYDLRQYCWILLASAFGFIADAAAIIATQNERSGFITLICYIELVYAFLGDLLFFSELPGALEIVGVLLIFIINILVICSKWDPPSNP